MTNGVATLTGTVPTEAERHKATQLATAIRASKTS